MNKTDQAVALLAACERDDLGAVEHLGWRSVIEALRYWRKRVNGVELAPYASLLGDEDPDAIVAVLQDLAGLAEFRPGPAAIYVRLHPPVQPGRVAAPRPDQTPEAYAAVRSALAAGTDVCECFPRPTTVEIDAEGRLRCPDCAGLEPGQVDAALEALG